MKLFGKKSADFTSAASEFTRNGNDIIGSRSIGIVGIGFGFSKQNIPFFTECPVNYADQRTDQNGSNNRTDANTSKRMQNRQAGYCGNEYHGTVKSDFYLGKFNMGHGRNCLHTTLSGKWNQVRRKI